MKSWDTVPVAALRRFQALAALLPAAPGMDSLPRQPRETVRRMNPWDSPKAIHHLTATNDSLAILADVDLALEIRALLNGNALGGDVAHDNGGLSQVHAIRGAQAAFQLAVQIQVLAAGKFSFDDDRLANVCELASLGHIHERDLLRLIAGGLQNCGPMLSMMLGLRPIPLGKPPGESIWRESRILNHPPPDRMRFPWGRFLNIPRPVRSAGRFPYNSGCRRPV